MKKNMNIRNRYDLKINLPHEDDESYHNKKVEAMLSAEEEFWRDNPDDYNRYLNYEREDNIPQPLNAPTTMYLNRYDLIKPLALLLFIQYGVFVWIVFIGFQPILRVTN